MSERDAKIQDLEHSLADLERKSKEAVSAAQSAVASAELARRGAEEHAAKSAADAAATYMRLESSLSQAEREVQLMESAMLRELRSLADTAGTAAATRPTGSGSEEDAKIAELIGCAVSSGSGSNLHHDAPGRLASTPRTAPPALEMVAAQMWAQLESRGWTRPRL